MKRKIVIIGGGVAANGILHAICDVGSKLEVDVTVIKPVSSLFSELTSADGFSFNVLPALRLSDYWHGVSPIQPEFTDIENCESYTVSLQRFFPNSDLLTELDRFENHKNLFYIPYRKPSLILKEVTEKTFQNIVANVNGIDPIKKKIVISASRDESPEDIEFDYLFLCAGVPGNLNLLRDGGLCKPRNFIGDHVHSHLGLVHSNRTDEIVARDSSGYLKRFDMDHVQVVSSRPAFFEMKNEDTVFKKRNFYQNAHNKRSFFQFSPGLFLEGIFNRYGVSIGYSYVNKYSIITSPNAWRIEEDRIFFAFSGGASPGFHWHNAYKLDASIGTFGDDGLPGKSLFDCSFGGLADIGLHHPTTRIFHNSYQLGLRVLGNKKALGDKVKI